MTEVKTFPTEITTQNYWFHRFTIIMETELIAVTW